MFDIFKILYESQFFLQKNILFSIEDIRVNQFKWYDLDV